MPAARWGNFMHQPRAFIAGLESHAKNIGGDVARPPPPVASGDPGMLGGASTRARSRARRRRSSQRKTARGLTPSAITSPDEGGAQSDTETRSSYVFLS